MLDPRCWLSSQSFSKSRLMLEIIILFKLCRRIGEIAEQKGRKGGWYKLMLVVFWIGGELFLGIAGEITLVVINGGREPNVGAAYLLALLGAVVGAYVAFTIAKSVPPKYQAPGNERDQELPSEEKIGGADIPAKPSEHFFDPTAQGHMP
jgi:hypothetical protein